MPKQVELVLDRDCPNVEAARMQLRRAFETIGETASWQEWDRDDPTCPAYARAFGSPTILVDREDVSGAGGRADANSCRVYEDEEGRLVGVPPLDVITAALGRTTA